MGNLKDSETMHNLMRAFAGESQARNRYTFAAQQAREQKLHVLEAVFTFTAEQERAHAWVFYKHLQEVSGQTISIDGTYPVDLSKKMEDLLNSAHHNEMEEFDPVYPAFAKTAREEGFAAVAASFEKIAEIEKVHGDRFGRLAELMAQGKLFLSDAECGWMCLNCGFTFTGKGAPQQCPVCDHPQGYFIRLELAPYTTA